MTYFIAKNVKQGDVYRHNGDRISYKVSHIEFDLYKGLVRIKWDKMSHYHTYQLEESFFSFELVGQEVPFSKEELVLQKIKYLNTRYESRQLAK